MKTSRILVMLAAVITTDHTVAETALVGPGSFYLAPFSTPGSVTHDVPGGGLLNVTLSGGTTSNNVGNWTLSAQGGANISLLGLGLLESGAQTALTGSSLRFGISNDTDSLLGALNTGTSLYYAWEAIVWFSTSGAEINFSPQSRYQVSFDVDGNSGLLDSVLGVTPSFSFQMVDAFGNPLTCDNTSSTLVNIAGILGTGVPTGTLTLDYTLGDVVPSGPLGIKFSGDVYLDETALGAGTTMATMSNLSLSVNSVPEPSGVMLLGSLALMVAMRRWRLKDSLDSRMASA